MKDELTTFKLESASMHIHDHFRNDFSDTPATEQQTVSVPYVFNSRRPKSRCLGRNPSGQLDKIILHAFSQTVV